MFDSSEFGRQITPLIQSIWRKPNILFALLMQLGLYFALPHFFTLLHFSVHAAIPLFILHTILASFPIILLRWNWWWVLIQLLLALALYSSAYVAVQAGYPLLVFFLLLLVHFGALRNRVPYFPSSTKVFPILLVLLPMRERAAILDLGSGYGRVLMNLQRDRQDLNFFGIELALLPFVCGRLLEIAGLLKAKLNYGDLFGCNLAAFDFVYTYLSGAVMSKIGDKVKNEMRSGGTFVSCEFPVENFSPDLTINYKNAPPLYVWRI